MFWKEKKLNQLSKAEWESLCDGCGKCCLHKLQDDATQKVFYTKVACKLLSIKERKCNDYQNREKIVPDCLNLYGKDLDKITWLPKTCAYRLLNENKDLPDWHPLISGNRNLISELEKSVSHFAVSESTLPLSMIENELEQYLLSENIC